MWTVYEMYVPFILKPLELWEIFCFVKTLVSVPRKGMQFFFQKGKKKTHENMCQK